MSSRQRFQVVGVSGAGKTTLGMQLARCIEGEYIELDSLYHQPGWTPLPPEEFRGLLEPLVTADRWVIDGNYQTSVGGYVRRYADTVVWLDPPKWLVMMRVLGRSVRRVVTGRELWNGNREEWRLLISRDPEQNIILWTWTQYAKYQRQYEAVFNDEAGTSLELLRLRSRRDVKQFLAGLEC